jgi:hypothetical protein
MLVLQCPESFPLLVAFDLVAVRAKELVTSGRIPQHSRVVCQSSTEAASDLRAAAAMNMVYLKRANVLIESADIASWAILLVDLLKHLTLSLCARVLGHDTI